MIQNFRLSSSTKPGVVCWLYSKGHTDETFYVNQLMQATGSGSGAVQRELRLMTEAGIVNRTQSGNMVYYQANQNSPIYNELKSIVRKTLGVSDVIRQSLEPVADKIRVAFIFGSIAAGTENRTSDIDVMVVGEITFDKVVSSISPAEEIIKREINPVVYPVAEFRQKIQSDQHFLKTGLGLPSQIGAVKT